MSASIKLDQTDRKILTILQKHAKITNAQLSKDIDLSPAPTLERVKKLENTGIIESYHAKLNGQLLGFDVNSFVSVKVNRFDKKSVESFLGKIDKVDEVIECHSVSGDYNFLLRIVAKDLKSFEQVLSEKISTITEVAEYNSMIIMSTPKDTKVIPVEKM